MSIPLNGPGPYLDGILALEVAGPGVQGDAVVAIGTPLDVACSQCGRPLRALLDLDLRDPRLAFMLRGLASHAQAPSRLRIPACEQCSSGWFIYADVTLSGGVSNARVRPKPRRESSNPFTREKMYFRGSDDNIPVNSDANWSAVSVRVVGTSAETSAWAGMAIGGTIHTQQEWKWPACIRCEKLMTYVSTVSYELDGQCYYGFWCRDCGIATSYCDRD